MSGRAKRSRPRRQQLGTTVVWLAVLVLVLGGLLGVAAYLVLGLPAPGSPGARAPSSAQGGAASPGAGMVPAPEGPPAPRPGALAPDIAGLALDGSRVALGDLRGKTVMVNFWASWCPPCEREMADLQQLYAEESSAGFVVLGVNEGEAPERAQTFLTRKGITFPNLVDPDMSITRRYEVFGLPNSFFVDPAGVVRARIVGPISLEQMRSHLQQVRQGSTVQQASIPSLFAATSALHDRPVAEVAGGPITLGEVNRRIDLELSLTAIKGGLVTDLTRPERSEELQQLQRIMTERVVDERVVARRAGAAGIAVTDAEVDADLARTAGEAGLTPPALVQALSERGSDIAVLRDSHRAASLIGRFVAERVLTGQNAEGLDDYEPWLAAARAADGVRILLP
ncbi:MAG: redoxin domain-containing protein [Chloroflexi bacterium]|nr:redoxin domain-containing protein [Chloroflexota bacterium]